MKQRPLTLENVPGWIEDLRADPGPIVDLAREWIETARERVLRHPERLLCGDADARFKAITQILVGWIDNCSGLVLDSSVLLEMEEHLHVVHHRAPSHWRPLLDRCNNVVLCVELATCGRTKRVKKAKGLSPPAEKVWQYLVANPCKTGAEIAFAVELDERHVRQLIRRELTALGCEHSADLGYFLRENGTST